MADFDLVLRFPHEKEKQQCVYTHRNFLAAESSLFHNLIFEDPSNPKTEIVLTNVNSSTVFHALQCISTAGKSLASERLAVLLRKFAKDYDMKTLYTLCDGFLVKHLTVENVEVIHDLACHFSDTNIQLYCWLKFDACWREIFSKASFYQCSDSTIRRFVCRPVYKDLDEFFLWNALYTWGLTKMLRENSMENPILHRKNLDEFLPHIRFLIMKPEELNVIFNSKLLTLEECNAIKIAFESKDVSILPPSICRSTITRSSKHASQYIKHGYSYFCPKHTNSRCVRNSDNFYTEFVPSHDCFLLGLVLPLIADSEAPPLFGLMEISKTNVISNKKEPSISWNLTVKTDTIKFFPPMFIERNWKVCVHLTIQISNTLWKIEPFTNCVLGQLEKEVCSTAELWKSFYCKEPLIYF